MKKYISIFSMIITLVFCRISTPLLGETVRISQIDNTSLLINQNLKLYISLTDDAGKPVKNADQNSFSFFESADGMNYIPVPDVESFSAMANYESGINFMLLIDNSGSMYRNLKEKNGSASNTTKIQQAQNAVITFLDSVSNPKDTVGLAAYNTYFRKMSDPVQDKEKVRGYLSSIVKPVGDEGYTEIYASLSKAVDAFREIKGRKALIILSDGENRPYYPNTGKAHTDYGKKVFRHTEPIRYCQEEGISVFAINFGNPNDKKERHLKEIAVETGGTVFDARDQSELESVYGAIVNQILNEYMVVYNATMEPADRKYVKVRYESGPVAREAARFYFSSTMFGMPLKKFAPLLLIPLLLSLLLAWLLSLLKFENTRTEPSLEVFNPGQTRAVTKMITLSKGKTIIGGAKSADMTIIGGVSRIKEKHATIVFDERKKNYTIISDGEVKVNNKLVKTRVLESGDVIDVGGATIIFDDGKK